MSGTNNKVKMHRNPGRSKQTPYKPYVPQYQIHGVEPQEYQSRTVGSGVQMARPGPLPLDNPRAKRAAFQQPFPNVGNNADQTWSGVDAEIISDFPESDINHHQSMVDNNDYVTDSAFGFQNGINATDINGQQKYGKVTLESPEHTSSDGDLLSIIIDLVEDSYLLIVEGVPLCSGPMEEIQDQARDLVFGEHEMCDGNPIPADDIIILKKAKIKVGLFLE